MPPFSRSDPLELRVLAALTGGAAEAREVAERLGQPEETVARILEQGVAEQAVVRHDLAGRASYSLTAHGLEAVGVYQGVQGAVDEVGHVDLGAATRLVMEQYDAAREVAADRARRDQAGWPADDAARERVSGALTDAYARGALTQEQLDDRVGRALAATTMGELRAAADGILDLPPDLPTGLSAPRIGDRATRLQVNPALGRLRWRYIGLAAALCVLGLFLLAFQPLVGLIVILAGGALGGVLLRPLLRTASVRVRH